MAQSPSASQPLISTQSSRNTPSSSGTYGSTTATATGPSNTEDAKLSPEATASYFSQITLSWMTPIFKIGYRRQLQEGDIYEMLPKRRAEILGRQLRECWDEERRKAQVKGRKPSLLRAMAWFILPHYWFAQVCLVISDNLSRLVPFIVLWIIVFLQDTQDETRPSPPPVWYGYGLAVLLLFTCMSQSVLAHIWTMNSVRTGTLLRTALTDMIFRKATTMSSKARLEFPDGTIFNMMATDASRIDATVEGMVLLIAVPIACLITVAMLMYLMGPSALLGTFVLILVNPLQAWAMTALNPIRDKASKLTDTRIRMVTEILQGIKVIKFFTFEPSFLKKVSDIRLSELKCLSLLMQVRGFIYSTSSSLPIFASALSFVLYVALGNELDAKIVFPAMTLFTGLRVPLLVLPYCYSDASDAWVSTKRIERFLLSSDTQPLPPVDPAHEYALSFRGANFYWDQLPSTTSPSADSSDSPDSSISSTSGHASIDDEAIGEEQQPLLSGRDLDESDAEVIPFLKDININIPRGALVAVVGPVGSGKSSLLQAMVGNMMKSQGEVIRGATISYASQTPWIQNSTIRNNILFDTAWDEERYWRVVKACSLEKDLSNMPSGDETEIGERGVNLSGGQKARLSLARSVYYDAEIVIMDDPLSAVDAHVGKRLWEDCVLNELGKKTRVIATHQLHVLPNVDYVICMKHGRVAEQGTFQGLMANEGDFYKLMKQYGGRHHHHLHHQGQSADGSVSRTVLKRSRSSADKVLVADVIVESDDDITVLSESESESGDEAEKPIVQSQMTEEERAYGAVSSQVYKSYFNLSGYFNWVVIVVLLPLQQAVGVAMSVWLSFWTEHKFDLQTWTYIDVYLGTGIVQLLIVMTGSFMLVVVVIKSSRIMHDKAFISVLYSPMSFFDTTPVGRILNRFSKDVNTIDNTLMGAINSFLIAITGIISVLILSAIFLPWMTPIMIPLFIVYYLAALYYQRTSRELKRLDALLRSHLFSYFSETLSGLGTLKAYHRHGIDNAIGRNQHNLDRFNKAYYHLIMGMRWIGIRVYTVGHLINFACVVLIVWGRNSIDPSTAGLVLSYLARLSSEMGWAIHCFANVENNMNSAERLLYYAESLEQEPPADIPDCKPEKTWPSQGQISFNNVSMRYRPGLPLVLNNISFDIQPGHLVGVVGRTGAGKSSLIQALFLLVELESGGVVIDGIETDKIGTADLRSKIAIIPQDPVLFQGTFRYNLDPLGRHTDQELWKALEIGDIKAYVQQQDGGLDAMITSQGENLSVGQRQLVCLSRALLAKSKIVVLDEATASVDLATDSLIQKAIRVGFADSTVITIAHRLNTVVDYHRILVMDQGQVAEYDTPRKLLRNHNSTDRFIRAETFSKLDLDTMNT
ncbi:hypothetical protein BGZ58_007436 [Dissophora ornata]|nr:hypothetical protein BGZ58_007436 [Dissophora ornata]